MRMFIYPYASYSESAKLLAEKLGIKRIKHRNSRYHPKAGDIVINWGKGKYWLPGTTLNKPASVEAAINKITAFEIMAEAGVSVPPFTTDWNTAFQWWEQGKVVVQRNTVTGHEGAGIVINDIKEDEQFDPERDGLLYTQYIKKKAEYRIHVGLLPDGMYRIIDQTQKVRKREFQGERDTRIRNTANGYVFKRNDIQVPADVINQAIEAVKALALDFGAVDVIHNQHMNKAYVLECNTAPGVCGTTVDKYADFFRSFITN